MKRVLTTGQCARLCKVAARTVSAWIDSGRLRGYRIPGSKARRVPADELVRFCREHGLPTDDILGDVEFRVLLIGDVPDLDGEFVTRRAMTGFDAGIEVEAFKPDCVVIDLHRVASHGPGPLHGLRGPPRGDPAVRGGVPPAVRCQGAE
jgi:excisionase family DNA binding protein